jgi:murein DD-endopeptidase MepM/ murein hydrolase activator NlpD
MVMTPSWGYLSPGNKDKYSRQAKYVTDKMMNSASNHMLQLGFSNPWMPSAEYTVATVDGEDEGVSIRYKDSFPYKCFSNVDWAISQILSKSGRSTVTVDEATGEVNLRSYRGENALKAEDFSGVLNDYYKLGFKNIIPAFGVMGTGYQDYRVSSEKGPGRLREEQDFIAAKEYPASMGDLKEEGGFSQSGGLRGKTVRDWNSGYFGLTVPCEDGDTDPRCFEGQTALDKMLSAAADFAALAGIVPEPTFETIEIPAMEWTDGWADYSIDEENVIFYVSPTGGADVFVQSDNTSNFFPDGCGECYDAIMAYRPVSEFIEQAVETIDTTISDIWPPVAVDDPPVKGRIAHSVMWWDWLNAEKHTPCWKSTRWDVIRNFHRHSPLSYERAMEGGNDQMFGDQGEFSARMQAANEAINAWNRVAASNPAMQNISVEAFMDAANKMPSLLSFDDASSMESYAQAAAHVAQSAATEAGYDAAGSAIGDGSDAASDVADALTDPDSYYGSDTTEAEEDGSTGAATETGEEAADSGESGGVGLDAYPPYGYIDFNSPVAGGSGGWMPAGAGHFTPANRDPGMIQQIVIHSTGGGSSTAGGSTFQGPGNTSAHYGINSGGHCFQFVQEKDIAHHAGAVGTTGGPPSGGTKVRRGLIGGQDKYAANQNSMSIGIEITGLPKDEAAQPGKYYSPVVLDNVAFLVANICRRNAIAIDRHSIIGHDEICFEKSDPGTWLQKEHPEGISYPYAGVDASGVNHGPKGGEMPDGWSHRQVSYSPNVNQEPTFPWDKFMALVTKFFDGAGVPMPPSTSFPPSTPAAATDGGVVGAPLPAAPMPCPTTGVPGMPGAAGAGGAGGGGALTPGQIAALGDVARTGAWPSGGSPMFSSDYGPRGAPCGECSSTHPGIDVVSQANPAVPGSVGSSGNPGVIPIYAVANGTIRTKRSGMSDSAGWWLGIEHEGGQVWSEYMHLHEYANVQVGQTVTAGTVIGTMGTSPGAPRSTGVHLHFGMKGPPGEFGGAKMDPAHALGLQCNEAAKSHSRYGTLCQPGNQNQTGTGPYPGY